MAKAFKTCKVCGAKYEYCHTFRRADGIFRWQDVACCPEHGSVYLSRIMASRAETVSNEETNTEEDRADIIADEDDDEFDELFEEEFEDEDYDEDTV